MTERRQWSWMFAAGPMQVIVPDRPLPKVTVRK